MATLRRTISCPSGGQLVGSAIALVLVLVGCGPNGKSAVPAVNVNPVAAANSALKLYDVNGDGVIDKAELTKCAPLAAAVPTYDSDANGQLTAEEITSRLKRQFQSGVSLTTVNCMVTLGGRPISGATVVFRPVAMLEQAVHPAQGVTDEFGAARPAIDREYLPENLQDSAMLQPGLYHVEITHPKQKLPQRYNTATILGCEVGPGSREGNTMHFTLSP